MEWTSNARLQILDFVGVTIYPERDDVLIVRRLVERSTQEVHETWDVQTVSGETLAIQCATREDADREARRIAQQRGVSVFYENNPSSAESILEFVISYRVDDAAPVA